MKAELQGGVELLLEHHATSVKTGTEVDQYNKLRGFLKVSGSEEEPVQSRTFRGVGFLRFWSNCRLEECWCLEKRSLGSSGVLTSCPSRLQTEHHPRFCSNRAVTDLCGPVLEAFRG